MLPRTAELCDDGRSGLLTMVWLTFFIPLYAAGAVDDDDDPIWWDIGHDKHSSQAAASSSYYQHLHLGGLHHLISLKTGTNLSSIKLYERYGIISSITSISSGGAKLGWMSCSIDSSLAEGRLQSIIYSMHESWSTGKYISLPFLSPFVQAGFLASFLVRHAMTWHDMS